MKIENIHFLPLSTTRLLTGKRMLNRDFSLTIDGETILVEKGFITDFSSYPWFSRILVRFDRVDVAGVIHDKLYYDGNCTRAHADKIWRLVAQLGDHSANPVQAWLSWAGLRLGGWIAWRAHAKRRGSAY